MSSLFFVSRKRDSNPRPTHYECVALPTELFRRPCWSKVAPNTGAKVESIFVTAKCFDNYFFQQFFM